MDVPMNYLCLSFVICLNLLIAPIAMMATAQPQLGEPLLVVASPWKSGGADRIILDAGGTLVGPTKAPLASMTVYEHDNYLEQLDQNGAWVVIAAKNLSALCG